MEATTAESPRPGPPRRSSLLARGLWTATVAACIATAALLPLVASTPHGSETGPGAIRFVHLLSFVALTSVGAIVARRRPEHPIGWLFVVAAALFALAELGHAYAHAAVLGGLGSAELGRWAALIGELVVGPAFALLTVFVPLVFPDGRLVSRGWRIVAWCGGVGVAGVVLADLVRPGRLAGMPEVTNPAGVPSATAVMQGVGEAANVLWAAATVAAVLAVATRFVRSKGAVRRQFEWVAFPTVMLILFAIVNSTTGLTRGWAGALVYAIALAGLPAGAGVAVLRYRLYDIDRVVRRTVTYVILTLVLLGIYSAGVVGAGWAVRSVTGHSPNDLVVASSTLAAAAMFQPARRRIQTAVDRRFNRVAYDAESTVADFGHRLRDEVDPGALARELESVVLTSIQPTNVSLWLPVERRPSAARQAHTDTSANEGDILAEHLTVNAAPVA